MLGIHSSLRGHDFLDRAMARSRERLPWFPFFPADWLADLRVRALTPAQRGIHIDLLALQAREGTLPDDAAALAAVVAADKSDVQLVLDTFYPKRGKRLTNRRLERILRTQSAQRQRLQESGRKGGLTGGKGRPKPGIGKLDADAETESENGRYQEPCRCNGDGAVRDDAGKILRTCRGCKAGLERGRRWAAAADADEAQAARAKDAKRRRGGTPSTPTKIDPSKSLPRRRQG